MTTAIKNTMDDAGFAVAEVLVRGDEKGVPDCGDCCESASVEDVIDKLRQGYGLYIVINPGKMEAVKMGDGATNDCR